jgi:hypothetical protein
VFTSARPGQEALLVRPGAPALALAVLILSTPIPIAAGGPDTLWTRTFGWEDNWVAPGDRGFGIALAGDEGAVITGGAYQIVLTPEEAFMIRLDRHGRTQWERFCCSLQREEGKSVDRTPDGDFVMAGYTLDNTASDFNILLAQRDKGGFLDWKRTYAGPAPALDEAVAYVVLALPEGGFIVGGDLWVSEDHGNDDIYILRTDERGDTLWTRTYGGSGTDYFNSIVRDESGYLVYGRSSSEDWLGRGLVLMKLNDNGDTLWTRTFSSTDMWLHGARALDVVEDGGYIVGATADLNTSGWGYRQYDILVLRIDARGDTLWTKLIGGEGQDNCSDIMQTSDGGFVLLGYTDSFGDGAYVVRMDASGDILWSRTYAGIFGQEICETADRSYMIVGSTRGFGAQMMDAVVIKTYPDPVHGGDSAPSLGVSEAWPNPVLAGASLTVEVSRPTEVRTSMYDVRGRRVSGPTSIMAGYGYTTLPIQTETDDGVHLASGIYFCVVETEGRSETRKIVIVR